MKQGLLSWSPCPHFLSWHPPLHVPSPAPNTTKPISLIHATINSIEEKTLSARERRQMRNDRRENKSLYNWREEVEERLMKKPKKKYKSWTEELNLDNLALLGPQWWVVRVSRVSGQDSSERIAKSLIRNFPDIEFKVFYPAVQVKRKLKNGSISAKPKPLFPGCVFLNCVMKKEIHDLLRECDGVGGFVGSKVGNTKRQINKPRPISADDMEVIFQQAKEEQEKADQAFLEEQRGEETLNSETDDKGSSIALKDLNSNSKKALEKAPLLSGSTVQVVSGAFADFSGTLKKLDRKRGMATVGFMLFGKETLADVDVKEIVAETS